MATYPVGTPPIKSQSFQLSGGAAFDGHGISHAPPEFPYTLRYSGIIRGISSAAPLADLNALKALHGHRDVLTRVSDNGILNHWCYARLLEIPAERSVEHVLHQPLEFMFEVLCGWRGTIRASSTELTTSPATIALQNDGDTPVTDLAITLTAGAADVTYLRLDYTGDTGNTSLEFTGLVVAGTDLVLQCGVPSIRNNGVDAYSNLFYLAGHSLAGWLQLDRGAHNVTAYRTITAVGNPTLHFDYYDAWL